MGRPADPRLGVDPSLLNDRHRVVQVWMGTCIELTDASRGQEQSICKHLGSKPKSSAHLREEPKGASVMVGDAQHMRDLNENGLESGPSCRGLTAGWVMTPDLELSSIEPCTCDFWVEEPREAEAHEVAVAGPWCGVGGSMCRKGDRVCPLYRLEKVVGLGEVIAPGHDPALGVLIQDPTLTGSKYPVVGINGIRRATLDHETNLIGADAKGEPWEVSSAERTLDAVQEGEPVGMTLKQCWGREETLTELGVHGPSWPCRGRRCAKTCHDAEAVGEDVG